MSMLRVLAKLVANDDSYNYICYTKLMIKIRPNLRTLIRWFTFGFIVQLSWTMGDVFFNYREFLLHKGYGLVPLLIIFIAAWVMHAEEFKSKSKNFLPTARIISAIIGNFLGLLFALSINQFF